MRMLRLVVLGNIGCEPYPGIAWQVAHFMIGLRRLGHDVYYFETSSSWPYDPIRESRVNDSAYALSYLAQVANHFGFDDRWAYRRSYGDKAWFGLSRAKAEELLAHADVILSITGSTRLAEEGLNPSRLVYVCTDPVIHECRHANGDEDILTLVDEHDDVVTFGENIGTPHCPLTPLPRLRARTRQPVVLDFWKNCLPSIAEVTTVGNGRQRESDSDYRGDNYYRRTHTQYMKLIHIHRCTHNLLQLSTA